MKLILIFHNGELIRQILYKTKREALGNYKLLKKHGVVLDYNTGETRQFAVDFFNAELSKLITERLKNKLFI